jgi:hypothetical protein
MDDNATLFPLDPPEFPRSAAEAEGCIEQLFSGELRSAPRTALYDLFRHGWEPQFLMQLELMLNAALMHGHRGPRAAVKRSIRELEPDIRAACAEVYADRSLDWRSMLTRAAATVRAGADAAVIDFPEAPGGPILYSGAALLAFPLLRSYQRRYPQGAAWFCPECSRDFALSYVPQRCDACNVILLRVAGFDGADVSREEAKQLLAAAYRDPSISLSPQSPLGERSVWERDLRAANRDLTDLTSSAGCDGPTAPETDR